MSSVPILSKRYLARDRRGGTPEESSEITKAGVIDGHFSIDLPEVRLAPLRNVRATDVSEWDNLFSVYFFFIPLHDRILPTTRFMTRTLSHSISEFQLRAEEMPSSKFPSIRSSTNFDRESISEREKN